MLRVNPQLVALAAATATAQANQTCEKEEEDEVMSSGPQSDQMTLSSPISHEHNTYGLPQHETSAQKDRALRKVINSDIEKGLKHLTQSI